MERKAWYGKLSSSTIIQTNPSSITLSRQSTQNSRSLSFSTKVMKREDYGENTYNKISEMRGALSMEWRAAFHWRWNQAHPALKESVATRPATSLFEREYSDHFLKKQSPNMIWVKGERLPSPVRMSEQLRCFISEVTQRTFYSIWFYSTRLDPNLSHSVYPL